MTFTVDDLVGKVRMQRKLHADGRDFSMNIDECVEHPDLARCSTFPRRGKGKATTTWSWKGMAAFDLEDAVDMMNGHVGIDIQIAAIERLAARDPDTLAAMADPATDMHELESVLKTLKWCRDNADTVREARRIARK
jgi:hypothetical protein